MKKKCLDLVFHNGVLQLLLTLWGFPKMTVNRLIKNWCFGNQRGKVPPLSLLNEKYLCYTAAVRKDGGYLQGSRRMGFCIYEITVGEGWG